MEAARCRERAASRSIRRKPEWITTFERPRGKTRARSRAQPILMLSLGPSAAGGPLPRNECVAPVLDRRSRSQQRVTL